MTDNKENTLHLNKHILLYVEDEAHKANSEEITFLSKNFCGRVFNDVNKLKDINYNIIVYMLGNTEKLLNEIENKGEILFCIVKELSYNYEKVSGIVNMVSIGEVPLNVHNVGVFFRKFFNDDKNYFDLLNKEHQFQSLTESNKPGKSHRNGLYISKVERVDEMINFNLLRCSTNLDGPTDNFRQTDNEVVNKVNDICKHFFQTKAELNHVLAQVYNNANIEGKERKAKISEHSDKTKDMPRNGLIAFTTFYQFNDNTEVKKHKDDAFDYYYKDTSVLTRLRFRLKKEVTDSAAIGENQKFSYDPKLFKHFDVVLYPNSVFVISLSTNRLYTHEIVPSNLPIDKLPTRLGYVIRCSKTKAIYKENQTYLEVHPNKYIKLEESTPEKIKELKDNYFKENLSTQMMDYGIVDFSLNDGDYKKPIV